MICMVNWHTCSVVLCVWVRSYQNHVLLDRGGVLDNPLPTDPRYSSNIAVSIYCVTYYTSCLTACVRCLFCNNIVWKTVRLFLHGRTYFKLIPWRYASSVFHFREALRRTIFLRFFLFFDRKMCVQRASGAQHRGPEISSVAFFLYLTLIVKL